MKMPTTTPRNAGSNANTTCPKCKGAGVLRARLPDHPGQWSERKCGLCSGRGWLGPRQMADLEKQSVW